MYPLIHIWKESDSLGGGSHGIRGDTTLLCLRGDEKNIDDHSKKDILTL
jgi:hypothetical protein